ncbi:Ras family, other [Fonticula alba]|uniref:small monomeric GTPase n=1 Tax=Fonticula alba TaxID=691883 RepID=A0A058ZBY8_FONAL|nr:Ras family, other [Fonticula alba]KCV71940.1 Ras family, other [Fonticula alba]|eukprot:XP_009493518.1 Ras family, other [Fonticula alba]
MSNKYSLVVVGSGGVGKSAVTLNFMRGQFVEEYDPTIEDSYCKQVNLDGVDCTLDITDTAGQEEYRGLWGDKFMRSGDGFLCVYSITSKSSFEEVEVFRDQILRAKDVDTCPMIILGNKRDLEDYREVDTALGEEFARNSDALFLETSAKEGYNIEEAFFSIVRHIRDHYRNVEDEAPAAAPEAADAAAVAAPAATPADAGASTADAGKSKSSKSAGGKKSKCVLL